MASFLGTLMQAATVAQNLANYNNKTPGRKGELMGIFTTCTYIPQ